ncbi:sensor histidine kinase [Sedimentibacter sp. MB31-C6]|uniref:sensor histidine kinase n=1 Tax=Sedimentibacter sp. MB31-C6 TaxID=3109366 RepID=UPI002DDD26B4|nr:HAMP domain-containing sensor histidine kinase [Sedimentibacter sp. MB36-C1]WSI04943.1 HAMP domain-containing sensor histidine kinase [Sedimentibacter sp. MB36-C1]
MFKRLHLKLTAYMGLILIFFMFFIATGIYNFTRMIFDDGTKEIMKSEAVRIHAYRNASMTTSIFEDRSFYQSLNTNVILMGKERLDACYVIYNENADRVHIEGGSTWVADNLKTLADLSLEEKSDSYVKKKIGNFNYRIYTKYFNDTEESSVVQVYVSTINEDILWSFLRTVLFIFGLTGMVALLCISYILTGQAIKPVKKTWVKQKQFVADASHELRTPLTVIQTNLDVVLSDDEGTVEENDVWLDNAYSETRVMAKLIDHLLILAKADANNEKLDMMEFSISEIVENVCGSMIVIANNKNIDFQMNIEEDLIIKADYDKIRRLIVILIDNAIKYTEKGSIKVSLFTEKNKKILIVEDTGIGISEKDINRIFDRFYRADKARHREGGTGLGLSIAKWIAESHRYILTVESTINVGTKFTLKM